MSIIQHRKTIALEKIFEASLPNVSKVTVLDTNNSTFTDRHQSRIPLLSLLHQYLLFQIYIFHFFSTHASILFFLPDFVYPTRTDRPNIFTNAIQPFLRPWHNYFNDIPLSKGTVRLRCVWQTAPMAFKNLIMCRASYSCTIEAKGQIATDLWKVNLIIWGEMVRCWAPESTELTAQSFISPYVGSHLEQW